MRKRIAFTSAAAAAAALITGCESGERSPAVTSAALLETTSTTPGRITGGGRIDPNPLEKTTFGFTVDGTSGPPFKGQLQTVVHLLFLKAHSVLIDEFLPDGTCVRFRGEVRTSDGPPNHRFRAVACDNGEPGSSPGTGPDEFGICIDDHYSSDPTARGLLSRTCEGDPDPTELTGGNIQLHERGTT
ncbi:MAG TPA: post-COAP-1 domain-containing protein [Myxococcaceae bacterium]|nr:post-COAP-1 domain-containing protein [Myxococcaceae bacterium]